MSNPELHLGAGPAGIVLPAAPAARHGGTLAVFARKVGGPLAVIDRYTRARQRPLPVLARIAWLTANRSINRRFVFALYQHAKLMARFDFGSPILAFYLGLYEHASMNFLLRYLKRGDVFADVGANVGVYSVLAGAVSQARVYAFEPVTAARQALGENIALNSIGDRVTVHKQGVGAAPDKALITTNRRGANTIVRSGANDRFEEIEIVTLDDVLSATPPDIIKIDVEGFEEQVLHGALKTLSKQRVNVVIVEAICRLPGDIDRVARISNLLQGFGFEAYTFDPDSNALAPCTDLQSFVGPDDENYLFIKDLREALRRIGQGAL